MYNAIVIRQNDRAGMRKIWSPRSVRFLRLCLLRSACWNFAAVAQFPVSYSILPKNTTAISSVCKRFGILYAQHCAGNRCPAQPPSLPDRIRGRRHSAFAREGALFAVRGAAALEPSTRRQTGQRCHVLTARPRRRVYRQPQPGSMDHPRVLRGWCRAVKQLPEVPDVHVPNPWR